MDDLKPCPFCGGEAKLEHDTVLASTYSYVKCINYLCKIKGPSFMKSTSYASDDRAIEAWNRRVENG